MYEGRISNLRVYKLLPSSLCKIPICNNPFQSNNISKFVVYSFLFYSISSSNILCIVSCLHSQPTPIIFLHPLSIYIFLYLLVHEQCTRLKKKCKTCTPATITLKLGSMDTIHSLQIILLQCFQR